MTSRLKQHFVSQNLIFFSILVSLLFSPMISAEIKGFQDFKGKPQTLENYTGKGKWLIVMMWASDCHICNREAHEYVDFHLIHSDTDATVLGISLDGEEKKKEAEKFIKKHMVDFPNLIAEPETVSQLYQELTGEFFAGTPSFLIFSPKGELKAAQAGAVPTKLIEDFIAKSAVKKVVDK
ncbi:MAG: TlpA disulfide reductase family protein [Woeseiaceae bacterium]